MFYNVSPKHEIIIEQKEKWIFESNFFALIEVPVMKQRWVLGMHL